MASEYRRTLGVEGTVLYPSRDADTPYFEKPPEACSTKRPITFAYAGTINSNGYANALATLAITLEELGCRMVVYSGLDTATIKKFGLDRANVSVFPFIPSNQLIQTLRKEADVLFVPMDFDLENSANMKVGFPSKITEYTAVGLPLLIWGPSYCSAVRWAEENQGVAEVVKVPDKAAFSNSVRMLVEQEKYRYQIASEAITRGQQYFSHASVTKQFFEILGQLSIMCVPR
jgi:glycosyltransferase involved in cell wall biosynthesis